MIPYRLAAVVLVLMLALTGCGSDGGEELSIPGQIIRISDTGNALPLLERLTEAHSQEYPDTELRLEAATTLDGAVRGVLDGTLDLAVANGPPSEEWEGLVSEPFARDAVVFAANGNTEVEGLSTEQIRAVYSGELTDWEQLGSSEGEILVLDRDETRDQDRMSRTLVLEPLMDGYPVRARTILLDQSTEMVEALQSTPGSLGYASLGLLQSDRSERVRVLSLDGVTPGPDAVARGEYPWFLTFTLIYREDVSPKVREFIEFVTGPEGRRLVEEHGYATV